MQTLKTHQNFLKNVIKVFSGSSIAQLFPMAGYLIILKQFDAEQFGIYAVWLGIVSLISMLSTLKLEQIFAIEYVKNPKTMAFSYLLISSVIALIISAIVVFFLFSKNYPHASANFFYYLVLGSLFTSLVRLYDCYLVAISDFDNLIKIRIINNFFVPFSQIILGIYFQTFEMLIIGYIIGCCIAFFYAIFRINVKVFLKSSFKEMKNFILLYKDIPSLKLPADFINNFGQQAPTFIVSYRFGDEYAGFLALTIKFLGAPLAIIGRSISDVFRPLLIKAIEEKGNCIEDFKRVSVYLFITSVLSLVIIFPFGEIIFKFLFGSEWALSGYFASILSLLFAFRMMASPVSYILTAYRKVGVELVVQTIILFVIVISFSISSDLNTTILLFSLFGSFAYLLYYLICLYYSYGNQSLGSK